MNRDVCEHFNPADLPCAKCEGKRKSEALFLADELEISLGTVIGSEVQRRAAAELRRLYMVDKLYQAALAGRNVMHLELHKANAERGTLQAQRDALIIALRAALAEPVQEPYAWMAVGGTIWRHKTSEDDVPLYTAPRVPLAEWQINDLMADIDPEDRDSWSFRQGVYAAEKYHGVRK